MASTNNRKTMVGHIVLSMLISSTFLLAIVFEDQNLYALTSADRYTSGFSYGEQQAAIDFQNNSPFNPLCVEHTSYYCAGYVKGYNVTWIGAIGIGTATQSAQAFFGRDPDDTGHGQSFHDSNGDLHSNGHA